MAYQQERDQVIVDLTTAGFGLTEIRKLLRYATTLHRLAEAQCNGDYPYGLGRHDRPGAERFAPCERCQDQTERYALTRAGGVCPDCQTQSLVQGLIAAGPKLCHKGHNFYVETDPISHARLCCTTPAYRPVFSGDPRGCVLHLVPASASDADVEREREQGIAIVGRY